MASLGESRLPGADRVRKLTTSVHGAEHKMAILLNRLSIRREISKFNKRCWECPLHLMLSEAPLIEGQLHRMEFSVFFHQVAYLCMFN